MAIQRLACRREPGSPRPGGLAMTNPWLHLLRLSADKQILRLRSRIGRCVAQYDLFVLFVFDDDVMTAREQPNKCVDIFSAETAAYWQRA